MKKLLIATALLGTLACTPNDRIAAVAIAGERASQEICTRRGTPDSLMVRTVRRDLRARLDIENPRLAALLAHVRAAADAVCGPMPEVVMPHPIEG